MSAACGAAALSSLRATGLLALFVLLATLSRPAQAQSASQHLDRENRFSVEMPLGFALRSGSDALGSYQNDSGMTLSLSRISYPALPAWRKNQREAFFAEIVEGAKRSSAGVRRIAKAYEQVEGVPTLDLQFSRKNGAGVELVWMRFLLFRKFIIVASAALPTSATRAQRKRAQAFPASLRPLLAIGDTFKF